jgi:hypothetical protein
MEKGFGTLPVEATAQSLWKIEWLNSKLRIHWQLICSIWMGMKSDVEICVGEHFMIKQKLPLDSHILGGRAQCAKSGVELRFNRDAP